MVIPVISYKAQEKYFPEISEIFLEILSVGLEKQALEFGLFVVEYCTLSGIKSDMKNFLNKTLDLGKIKLIKFFNYLISIKSGR